jgi:CubicO group peptidase (beta-lactamase class C family)
MIRVLPRLRFGVVLAAACSGLLMAQVPNQPAPVTPPLPAVQPAPGGGGLKDRADLEAFLDGVIAAQKDATHLVGATVSVVVNGELFFSKGYGYADLAKGRRVDAERTMFRVGSVSKLFTWTAVMQLVEQGKLDLKADVNKYLGGSPVKVPEGFSRPVTMLDLMTHTPGFEDSVIGLFGSSAASVRPLGEVLSRLPDRVRTPGYLASYSNHGTALAGYIVERVTGVPFDKYIEQHILEPLAMTHTAVRQPVPGSLAGDLSVGYRWEGGENKAQDFEFVPPSPAGSISASATDMARFMIAHLQDGKYGETRILSEETARIMHSRSFGHSAALNGMMLGFYQMNRNGRRIYGHGGDTRWFHSELALLPDEQVGIFVSVNSDSAASARTALVKAFVDRYFPDPSPAKPAASKLREPSGTFAGSYRTIRISYSTLAKLAALGGDVSVTELPDGRLLTNGLGSSPKRWTEVGPMTFQDADTGDRIAFLKDADGKVSHLVVDFPAIAFERLEAWHTPAVHFSLTGGSLLILLSAIIAWPIGWWRGRKQSRAGEAPPRWGRIALWCAAVLLVGFVVSLAVLLADPESIVFGVPMALKVALTMPLVAAGLILVAAAWVVRGSLRRQVHTWSRIYYLLVTAAAMVFLVMLNYWRLFGYRY